MNNVRPINGITKVTTTYLMSLLLGIFVGLVVWAYVQQRFVEQSTHHSNPIKPVEVGAVLQSNPTLPMVVEHSKSPVKTEKTATKPILQRRRKTVRRHDPVQRQPSRPKGSSDAKPKIPIRVTNESEQPTASNPTSEAQTAAATSHEPDPLSQVPDTTSTVPLVVAAPIQLIRNSDFDSPDASDKMPDAWSQFHIGGVQTVTIKTHGDIPTSSSGNVVLLDGVEKNKYYPGIYQIVDCPKNVYKFEVKLRYMHYDKKNTKRVRALRVSLDLVNVKSDPIVDERNGVSHRLITVPNGKLKSGWENFSYLADFSNFRSEYDSGLYRLRISIAADSDFGRVTDGEGLYIDSVELWTKP